MGIKPASTAFVKAGSTCLGGNRPPSIYITATSIPTKGEPWTRNDGGLSLESLASQPLAEGNLPYQLG